MGFHHCFARRVVVALILFLSVFALGLLIEPIYCQQLYDKSSCYSQAQLPGSNYLCYSRNSSCDTFVVYRVQNESQALYSIASLMGATDLQHLSAQNKLNPSDHLVPGEEIIVPVSCNCSDRYSRALLMYNYSSASQSVPDVACVLFEGLVKAQVLLDENQGQNVKLKVPLRCACPTLTDVHAGIKFLVTYPVVQNDSLDLIAKKFGVSVKDIADANGLDMYSVTAIFAQTTLLIPTSGVPVVKRGVQNPSPPPASSSFPLDNIVKGENTDAKMHYALLGGGLLGAIMFIGLAFFAFVRIRVRYGNKHRNFEPLSDKAGRLSNFSPDFITGMSQLKQSLIKFTAEEIRAATDDFNKGNVIGSSVFIGRTTGGKYAMQEMDSDEAAQRVSYILTRINHLNVVKLMGCCYDKPPYLVFEYAENGSMRGCLSSTKLAGQFSWTRRMQIAFDLAVGLHYLHYSTKPAYIHRNINSRNVLITTDWRAKISGFGLAKPVMDVDNKVQPNLSESVIVGRQGYLAPEYLLSGSTSSKVDVYAFGVVLLELMSAKEAINEGKYLKESVMFLADRSVQDTLHSSSDKLREFMDPALNKDYTLGTAVCVALLAKCCVADDPQLRPNMNDVLKTLSKAI